jgi:hypothetical protein
MSVLNSDFSGMVQGLTVADEKPAVIVKPFICQLLSVIQISDQLLASLIDLPPQLYIVDAFLSRMSPQVKSQIEMRYLIAIAKHASPAMLFRFKWLVAVTSNLTVSSLALAFIQRLKSLMHRVDSEIMIPQNVESGAVRLSSGPEPVDDTVLESLAPLVSKYVIGGPHNTPHRLGQKPVLSKLVTYDCPGIRDFDFLAESRKFVTAYKDYIMIHPSFESKSGDQIDIKWESAASPAKLDDICNISACGDTIIVAGTHSGTTCVVSLLLTPSHVTHMDVLWNPGLPISCTARIDNQHCLICNRGGQVSLLTPGGVSPFLDIPQRLGYSVSLCTVPKTNYFVIGTSEGTALLYDFRMQCPVRRMRACNRSALVCSNDALGFWMSCGRYIAKFDVHMDSLVRTVCVKGTHVTGCCCVKDWCVTCHTDYSVFGFNERRGLFDMERGSRAVLDGRGSEGNVIGERSCVLPRHEGRMLCLKSLEGLEAPVSCDVNGRLVFWPLPEKLVL